MDTIISLISFIIILAVMGYSIYINVKLIFKNREMSINILQLMIDKQVLGENLQEEIAKHNIEKSEGFLKFVSQSRDWAFEYIENVQSALTNFVETVGPTMEYYDKFGRINETPSMNTIFEAYTKLVKILPETNEKQGETK